MIISQRSCVSVHTLRTNPKQIFEVFASDKDLDFGKLQEQVRKYPVKDVDTVTNLQSQRHNRG